MQTSPSCAFCGTTDVKLTNEHVYPRHWRAFFPEASEADVVRRMGRFGFQKLRGAPNRFENQVRTFCGKCNAGWMRELDEDVKPFVIPFTLGDSLGFDADQTSKLTSWATKIALVRTMQDRSQAQQADPARFHEFFAKRSPFGKRAVQFARAEGTHLDNNSSRVFEWQDHAAANIVTFTIRHLFVQVAIYDASKPDWESWARFNLANVRRLTSGRVQEFRPGRALSFPESITETEVVLAREPEALSGRTPALANSMKRVPWKSMPGASFGVPPGTPDINMVAWEAHPET